MNNPNDPVNSRLQMEGMINRFASDLEKLREQMKTQKSMFDDTFRNDPEWAKQEEAVKEATRVKNTIKQRIVKQPGVAEIADRLKHLKEEIKDTQEGLSSYLQKFYQETGTNQIIDDDGEVREIVFVTKLVKKTA